MPIAPRCDGWSLAILGALEPVVTAQRAEAGNHTVTEMLAYLKTLVDARRAQPGDPTPTC